MKRLSLPAVIFIILLSFCASSAGALGVLDELINELDAAIQTEDTTPFEEIKPGQTRQKAKDEIARHEKMPAQIEEMLKQAWEAGRTQKETVITTPYGKVTIKFNLAELLKQRYTGDRLAILLNNQHGEMVGSELRINNGGSWQNKTYEGMKATIAHELGHYIADKRGASYPVLDIYTGYKTDIDLSEIEADAFAMRYIGRDEYLKANMQSDSSSYKNAVIKRMEEMESEELGTIAELYAVANAPTEAAARQEMARVEAARKAAEAAQKEAVRQVEAARQEAIKRNAEREAEAARQREAAKLDPKTHFNSGKTNYDKKDYDKAIVNFTEAIRLDPNYAEAYSYRAGAYYGKKDYDKAIADYTELIRLKPDASSYSNRAGAYYLKKDYDKAIADYTEAARLKPDANTYKDRAVAYNSKGDYDKAIADYTEAIRLKPDSSTYSGRAGIYDNKKDYDKAIADYTEAIRLGQLLHDTETAYIGRAVVYNKRNKKGDYDNAIADCNKAILYNSKSVIAYAERGWAFFQKRKYKEARADANTALQINPNFQRANDLDAELKKKKH